MSCFTTIKKLKITKRKVNNDRSFDYVSTTNGHVFLHNLLETSFTTEPNTNRKTIRKRIKIA